MLVIFIRYLFPIRKSDRRKLIRRFLIVERSTINRLFTRIKNRRIDSSKSCSFIVAIIVVRPSPLVVDANISVSIVCKGSFPLKWIRNFN